MRTIPINTPTDFEYVCLGYVSYHEGIQCFSRKGEGLYERYCLRLFAVGQRMFPGADMKIEASHLAESEEYEEDD